MTLIEGQNTKGILVVDINATDEDEGSNCQLVFSIKSGNLGNVFNIENETVFSLFYVMFVLHLFKCDDGS